MGSGRSRHVLAMVVAVALAGVVAACSSPEPEPSSPEPFPSEVWPTPDVWPKGSYLDDLLDANPVKLSTKCGIQFLQIQGTTWETSPFGGGPPTKWGNGGPPPGWPSPNAKGYVKFLKGKALYRSIMDDPKPGDVLRFKSIYKPRALRFHYTTKTPPPCP
ncbi:MAG: hypothetical protein U0990_11735 [Candidatus Nanopelagicales bacterium]|nr:hypothetical protein [Candidatus Nanopelagicales bacterium]MDZ4250738.1 hypothetical protein [Candidatus Nanopelagicales bacterium]